MKAVAGFFMRASMDVFVKAAIVNVFVRNPADSLGIILADALQRSQLTSSEDHRVRNLSFKDRN